MCLFYLSSSNFFLPGISFAIRLCTMTFGWLWQQSESWKFITLRKPIQYSTGEKTCSKCILIFIWVCSNRTYSVRLFSLSLTHSLSRLYVASRAKSTRGIMSTSLFWGSSKLLQSPEERKKKPRKISSRQIAFPAACLPLVKFMCKQFINFPSHNQCGLLAYLPCTMHASDSI